MQTQRRHRAVGAVGHRRVHAGGLLGRRFNGHCGIAARQRQQLALIELEVVGFFKRRQGIRALDKLGRGGQLKVPFLFQVAAEIVQRGEFAFFRQILAHRNGPGVVGRGRGQPDQVVLLRIKLFDFLIPILCIFPCRVVFIFEEEGSVASVFRVDIQLARGDRSAHHRGGAKLDFIDRFNAVAFQHLQNDIAEQGAFCIDFRPDFNRLRRL
ncbi:hypothetical protein D3C75_661700 [compost metagenome]